MIAQAREGIKAQININRSVVTIARARLTDSGFDSDVENPDEKMDYHKIVCRVSHEHGGRMDLQTSPVGFTSNLSRYILVSYSTDIKAGDLFVWHGIGYEIGPVDPLFCQDKIIGYQAPLKESANADEATQCR